MISERKKILSWAMYDWANSAFATTVMAGFFPIFFKQYWSAGSDVTVSSFQLGLANSVSSIVVAIMAPILGAIADCGGIKRRFLILFSLLGATMTVGLFFASKGDWQTAVILYVLASVGFAGANGFYDSQLVDVAPKEKFHRVSALGYSLGYLGGGVLFAINVFMTLKPEVFGFADAAQAVRVSFLTVGVWWILFALPIYLFVEDPKHDATKSYGRMVREGVSELRSTIRKIGQLKVVLVFLAAYWLYIDGVGTVIRMAVDYGMSLGFESSSLIVALLITQFVGFPCAILFGKIGEKWGAKTGIYIALTVYVAVTIGGYFMHAESHFYMLAVAIGTVQGGIQALSRSVYAKLIPPEQGAEFFGFFNMFGKFAAVMGPAVMGYVGLVTGSPRAAILSIIFFFIAGGLILAKVDIKKGEEIARTIEL